MQKKGAKVLAIPADVTSDTALKNLVDSAISQFKKIDVNIICPMAITLTIQEIIDSMPEGQRILAALGYKIPPFKSVRYAYEDITPTIVFPASDDSKHITRQTLRVDGGATIYAS